MPIKALSRDARLPLPWTGKVLSVHSRAANLISKDDRFIFLVGQPLGDGPGRIVLDSDTLEPLNLSPGQKIHADARYLYTADQACNVSLERCKNWSGSSDRLPAWTPTPAELNKAMAMLPNRQNVTTQRNDPVDSLFLQRTGELSAALAANSSSDISAAVASLLGLGKGLTPSGDDYLRGLMCCLLHLAPYQPGTAVPAPVDAAPTIPALQALQTAVRLSAHATTPISAAFLKYALEGRFAQHELDLLASLHIPASLQAAIIKLTAVGATSGQDFLLGAHDALQLLLTQETSTRGA